MSSLIPSFARQILAALLCWGLVPLAWAASGTLTVINPNQSGFNPQTHTSSYLKTVDFATNTLSNSAGISQGSSTLNSGSWGTTTSSVPMNFSGAYAKLASKDGASSSAATTLNFTNGTDYVSFLWFLGNADSDNTITFNLSDGSSQAISNCGSNTTSCVGGYDADGFITSLFNFLLGIFGSTTSTSTVRLVYTPPSGTTISSMSLKATSIRVCTLFIFCSYQTRSLAIDNLSYDDDTSGDLNPNGVLHHLEIYGDSSQGVTCAPSTFRVRACANAACTNAYTGGVSGNVQLKLGGSTRTGAYTIASGSAWSGDVGITANSVGTWVASATSTATATGANTCAIGALSTSSNCNLAVNASGLVLTLDPHYAGNSQPLSVQVAVGGFCTPSLLSGGNLLVSATATYLNSVTPTLTDSLSAAHSLANGVAVGGIPVAVSALGLGSNTFKYAAGGAVKIGMSVTGVSSLLSALTGTLVNLSGDVVTRVVPKSLRLVPALNGTDLTASTAKLAAGVPFQLKIEGQDANGNLIPIDPDLSVLSSLSLTKTVIKPVAANLNNNPGLTTGALAVVSGMAQMDVSWDEVGTISLGSGGITNFQGSGLNVAAGVISGFNLKFVPARFALELTPPCSAGGVSYVYAGQPFDVTVKALNAANVLTQNYDGTASTVTERVANMVTISAVSGLTNGTLSGSALADTSFEAGVGSGTITDAFSAAKKLSPPETVGLNAADVDTSANQSTPTVLVRSGRIKLSNAYGSESATLKMPVQVQYWDGKAWVPVTDTSCAVASNIPTAALVKASFKSHKGATLASTALPVSAVTVAGKLADGVTDYTSPMTLSNGAGYITLTPPGKGITGTVDITLDLSGSGANMSWLQSLDASCGANTLCNPKARASFGVFAPESKKTVNVRNVF
jgi:MSHA biogenesis protein MshQ